VLNKLNNKPTIIYSIYKVVGHIVSMYFYWVVASLLYVLLFDIKAGMTALFFGTYLITKIPYLFLLTGSILLIVKMALKNK